MIKVTRINNVVFYINPDLIEFVEETPNTVITLVNGKKYIVEEPVKVLIEEIVKYRRMIYTDCPIFVESSDEV